MKSYITAQNANEILTQPVWNAIAAFMDADVRETVHNDLAPCTEFEFLSRYLELDPDFSRVLENEFSIVF